MEPTSHEEHRAYRLAKNRFAIMIIASIAISLVLVVVAMWLYNISGAAQVDLSRPGYQSIRDRVVNDDAIGKPFPSTGAIDDSTLREFRQLFDATAYQIQSADSFTGDQLSDQALGISE